MSAAIQAVIPVRGGSERVKNKNLRPFAGSNLLACTLDDLRRNLCSEPKEEHIFLGDEGLPGFLYALEDRAGIQRCDRSDVDYFNLKSLLRQLLGG